MTRYELVAAWTVAFIWAAGALIEIAGMAWFGFSDWNGRASNDFNTFAVLLTLLAAVVGFVLSVRGYLPGTKSGGK